MERPQIRNKIVFPFKYLSNEAAAQARQLLDNRDLDGFCLQVKEKTQLLILLIMLMDCLGLI